MCCIFAYINTPGVDFSCIDLQQSSSSAYINRTMLTGCISSKGPFCLYVNHSVTNGFADFKSTSESGLYWNYDIGAECKSYDGVLAFSTRTNSSDFLRFKADSCLVTGYNFTSTNNPIISGAFICLYQKSISHTIFQRSIMKDVQGRYLIGASSGDFPQSATTIDQNIFIDVTFKSFYYNNAALFIHQMSSKQVLL